MCVSYSVVSNPLQPQGLQCTRPFRPWSSPGKSTGVAQHSLLRGFFSTQGLHLSLLCCCLLLSHQGSSSCLCNPNSALPTFFLFPFIFAFPTELDFKKIIPYLVIFFSQRHIVPLTLSHIKISINGYIYSYITYMQYMYACFITYAICMCFIIYLL